VGAYSGALGAEPLDPAFTAGDLSALLRASRQAVKKVLMDQRRVVGVGNIYANESLWRAGIDPSRAADTLTPTRGRACTARSSGAARERGAPRDELPRLRGRQRRARGVRPPARAYGRGGEPCLGCRARLVETHAVDGRSTVFCAWCQK
jgi:formamidopyrimidine-DNA glycosylase